MKNEAVTGSQLQFGSLSSSGGEELDLRFNSDSMNDERLNPSFRAKTLELLNACALMLKKSAILAD